MAIVGGLRVLVVDDDPDIRNSVSMSLADEGFDVNVATDGFDALTAFEAGSEIDVLVCDLEMPRLNGPSLVQRLRRRGHRQLVVLLSGRFDLLADSSDLGQVYALAKPVSVERLIDVIRQAFEERS